ncbi:acyltransferase [Paraburkholderia sediminicola]|uniref:acyltransferase family protein n=1 Tax=Paraburkholderia sediminicola TaxID=458836 RepID=UPI0038B70A60
MHQRLEVRSLTGLRAVAALFVFFFHIQIRWPFAHSDFLANLIGQGAIGMSVFFVLSGFVLAYQYSERAISYREYLGNRVARIYPIYALSAVLTLPWIGINLHDGAFLRGAGQLVTLVLANVFVIQAWFPQFFPLWNDGASWSISVEAFCYVLLPLILAGLYKIKGHHLYVVMVSAYAAAVLPGLTFLLFDNSPSIFYSMPIFRLAEFVLGVCVCIVARRGSAPRSTTAIVAAALVVGLIVYLGTQSPVGSLYVTHNWLVLPAVAMAIYFLSKSNGVVATLMGSDVVVWLGKISYCIYSLQALIILPLIHHHDQIVSMWPALVDNRVLLLVSLALLIAASAAAHHLIEEPIRLRMRGMAKRAAIRFETP